MIQNFWPQTLVDWAQVISALATAASVIVALWLSSRNERERIDLTMYLHHEFTMGNAGDRPSKRLNLCVRVTNIGQRPVEVSEVNIFEPLPRSKRRWMLWDAGWHTRKIPLLFYRTIGIYVACHPLQPNRSPVNHTGLISFGQGLEYQLDVGRFQTHDQVEDCLERCVLIVRTASHNVRYRRLDPQSAEAIRKYVTG